MDFYGYTVGKRAVVGVLVLAAMAAFAGAASAQTATGTITGTVTDQKGLAMTGATILIHSEDTGIDLKPILSGDAGLYVAPLLPVGNYDVTASQTGFGAVEHKGVTLQVGQTLRLDFEMPVATQQSVVTVTTEAPLLETEKTEQSENIDENMVNNLPAGSRNFQQYQMLAPGLNPDGTGGAAAFHGINSLYSNNTVDGANNNSNYGGGARGAGPYTYSADSIREFSVSSSGFSADTGQSAGGAVNAVTKSGTNQFHGDLFFYGREPQFNAYDPVAKTSAATNGTATTQPIHQQYQFGGSAGGPLIKDKLFIFGTFDSFREVEPQLVSETAQTSPAINSPAFGCPQLKTFTATQNLALMNDCSAVKSYLFTHVYGTFNRDYIQGIELIKLDWQVNSANHLSGVTNWHDTLTTADRNLYTGAGPSVGMDRFVIANLTTLIGSNKVNSLVYQYGIDNNLSSLGNQAGMPGVTVGSSAIVYGLSGGGPGISLETRNQIQDNFSFTKGTHSFKTGVDMNFINDNQRSASNSGGAYTYSDIASLDTSTGCGTTANGGSNDGAFCAWLLDLYGVNVGDGLTGRHFNNYAQFVDLVYPNPPRSFDAIFPNNDFAAYFQDSWKVRPNITVNMGVRYDLQVITDLQNSISNLLAQGKIPSSDMDLPIYDEYASKYPNEYDAFQPRFGIADNVRKHTVLRFNAGIFFAKTEGHNVKNVVSGAEEITTQCSESKTSACAIPTMAFPNILYNEQNAPLNSIALPGVVAPTVYEPVGTQPAIPIPNPAFGIRAVGPSLKRPRVLTLNMGIEEQLPHNMNLAVNYIYTAGFQLPLGNDFNLAPNYDAAHNRYVTETYNVLNTAGVPTETFTLPLYYAPLVPATGPLNGNTSPVHSIYNGLEATFRIPTTHGLELLANYTYSHSIDDGEQGAGNTGNPAEGQLGITPLDPNNLGLEWGNSGTDLRHRFTSSVIWSVPYWGHSSSTLVRQMFGGISMAASITAQSGSHYTAQMASSSTTTQPVCYNNGTGLQVLDVTSGAGATCSTGNITAGTFSLYSPLVGSEGGAGIDSPGNNTPGRFGGAAPGFYQLPPLYNVDIRLEKDWTIRERYHFALRGEAFNLFNSTLVQAVSTQEYSYAAAGSSKCPASINGTNTCLVYQPKFGTPTTTSGTLLTARQLQAGVTFSF